MSNSSSGPRIDKLSHITTHPDYFYNYYVVVCRYHILDIHPVNQLLCNMSTSSASRRTDDVGFRFIALPAIRTRNKGAKIWTRPAEGVGRWWWWFCLGRRTRKLDGFRGAWHAVHLYGKMSEVLIFQRLIREWNRMDGDPVQAPFQFSVLLMV